MRRDAEPVEWPKPARWTQAELVEIVRSRLSGCVSEAYLFGSYARGTANDASDIDLVVIRETTERWVDRADALLDTLRDLGPIDLLVYTPSEWARRAENLHFAQDIAAELLRII